MKRTVLEYITYYIKFLGICVCNFLFFIYSFVCTFWLNLFGKMSILLIFNMSINCSALHYFDINSQIFPFQHENQFPPPLFTRSIIIKTLGTGKNRGVGCYIGNYIFPFFYLYTRCPPKMFLSSFLALKDVFLGF